MMASSETPLHYKCVKNKLKNIVIDGEAEGIVKEAVLTVHRIAIHAMQFIKLFLLHHYEAQGSTPTVTKLLVMNCMAVVRESKEHKNTKNKADMAVLRSVFESKYKPTMHESDHAGMIGKNLTQVLNYCATSIVAEYETNIKQHYVEYVERFVNVLFDRNGVATPTAPSTSSPSPPSLCITKPDPAICAERERGRTLTMTAHPPGRNPRQSLQGQ